VPDDFGGMTSALLHRSRAFVRLAGQPVDVLTFDARPDYAAIESRLRERGELIDGMRLVNLWDWLAEHTLAADAPGTLDLERHPFTPLEPPAPGTRTSTRYADDGSTVLQVDSYRVDGTLLVSDRRDVTEPGRPGGRSVVLCDAAETPVRSWGGIWGLYRFWLDLLRNREPSFLIVDSKTVARFARTYRRKRAVIVHVVHNSHLAGDSPSGGVRQSRREVFEHIDEFDGVVVLTERQRRDIEEQFGALPNLSVIPNSRDLGPRRPSSDRERGRGIVLASFTGRKRVDHSVRAVMRASEEVPVTLDVFGDGERRPEIEQLVGGSPIVRLHGFDPRARENLAAASFILLTGRSEGFPLVLVEAMAAGCIPIAYDVPYGPADMIVDGRNGFLVRSGDEKALADAVIAIQRLPKLRVTLLRRNARRTAARYSDLEVTRLWSAELKDAAARKAAQWGRITA
jgi:poly(glycerol-phosphate) alpha-glucosyltransferase